MIVTFDPRRTDAVEFLFDEVFDADEDDFQVEILGGLDGALDGDLRAEISPHGVDGDLHLRP